MAKAIDSRNTEGGVAIGQGMANQNSGANIGDYRLFKAVRGLADRRNFGNAKQARNVVFPGEVIVADQPNRNFTYYWFCPFGNDRSGIESELEGLLDEGWEQVKPVEIGGRWKVTDRFRRNTEGYPTWAGHVLYALPAEVVDERDELARRRSNPQQEVRNTLGSFSREARNLDGTPVQPFIKMNGKTENL